VKGAIAEHGPAVVEALREVLDGQARGIVPAGAGRPPLVDDFWATLAAHRVNLGDDPREVRCDIGTNPKHRSKSSFFHRCRLLEIPMFDPDEPYRGPDWAERTALHLRVERWRVVADVEIDDRLVALAERGTTIGEVALAALHEQRLAAGGDVAACARLVVAGAQLDLDVGAVGILDELEQAAARDADLRDLVSATTHLALLGSVGRSPTDAERSRVDAVMSFCYERACVGLPSIRSVADAEAHTMVDALKTLVRFAVAHPGPALADRRGLLVDRLGALSELTDGQPLIRGAAFGLSAGLGATSIARIATELSRYLRGPVAEVRRGGAFLEGVLGATRSAFVHSGRLLAAVHDVVVRLPDDEFLGVLPDLRRAFSVFVPSELEAIGGQVAELLGRRTADLRGGAIPEPSAAVIRDLDARIAVRLAAASGNDPDSTP
ncbi:MAG: DUF5682 family protein, partial [Myxococcota bacterium]